jgi:hypothetical protein
MGPAIWAAMLAAFGFIFAIFRRYIIEKAKQHKLMSIILIVVLIVITYFMFFNPEPEQITQGGLIDAGSVSSGGTTETVTGSSPTSSDAVFDESLSGAHMHNADKVYDGYNLYHGKLIDMDGNVVHNWSEIYMPLITPEGDYIAQEYYESPKFGKYTWDDEVIWEKNIPIHHDIILADNGHIFIFTKEVQMYNGRDVEFDIIVELDSDGNEIQRWSTWDNLKMLKEFHRPLELDQPEGYHIPDAHRMNVSIWGGHYDYYHLHYLDVAPKNDLEGTHPAFNPGNWIISFRHGSMVFILDKDTKQVLWRAIYDQVSDNLEGQHSPQMLPDGRILLFDNGRYREWSRVIELDPVTLNILWQYKSPDFFTLSQGHAQRLPNGNTLVTESEEGHAFEITRNGEIVWEYYIPEIQDKTNSNAEEKWGQRQEISRMTRYPKDFIEQFLDGDN